MRPVLIEDPWDESERRTLGRVGAWPPRLGVTIQDCSRFPAPVILRAGRSCDLLFQCAYIGPSRGKPQPEASVGDTVSRRRRRIRSSRYNEHEAGIPAEPDHERFPADGL
jgi:hypothetical protein